MKKQLTGLALGLVTSLLPIISSSKDITNYFDLANQQENKKCDSISIAPLIGQLDFQYQESFNGYLSWNNYAFKWQTILENWKKYADKWEEFVKKYPNFNFGPESFIKAVTPEEISQNFSLETKNSNIDDNDNKPFTSVIIKNKNDFFSPHSSLKINLLLYHDEINIYWGFTIDESSVFERKNIYAEISLTTFIFY